MKRIENYVFLKGPFCLKVIFSSNEYFLVSDPVQKLVLFALQSKKFNTPKLACFVNYFQMWHSGETNSFYHLNLNLTFKLRFSLLMHCDFTAQRSFYVLRLGDW